MSYVDQVAAASGPQTALSIIAQGIDAILERLDSQSPLPAADSWEAWGSGAIRPVTPEGLPAMQTPHASHESAEAVRQQLAETTDGEERRALEAKLRLLQDDGAVPEPAVPEGQRIVTTTDADAITVNLPAPDGRTRRTRYDWAYDIKLGHMIEPQLDEHVGARAYAKGGPMWLYLYDRDAVMKMPPEWRRMFVTDVQQQSPAQAQELARDILKDTEPGTSEQALDPMAAR